MNGEFNLSEFLIKELKDLRKKIDDDHIEMNENFNSLKICIHTKINEVKNEVGKKSEEHMCLHLADTKSFISLKLFIFCMLVIIGCIGTVFTLSYENKNDITIIKTKVIENNEKLNDKFLKNKPLLTIENKAHSSNKK